VKYVTSQMLSFMNLRSTQRNIRALVQFFLILAALVTGYSILFHYVMMHEGRDYSWVTGFYWTLTVMSTLGFGDITFESDLGRLFSILVLLSGIVFLLILLPFTIIQFFYAPWVEAQATARAPRELAPTVRGHVILTHHDPVTAALIRKLRQTHHEYVLLVPDAEEAVGLHDEGLRVVVGQLDDPETYRRVRAEQAALVATTESDIVNTNIAFTVRQAAPDTPIVATAETPTTAEILERAGATHVISLGDIIGRALARSMVGGDAVSHVVGSVDELLIAEANAHNTPLVGKTIRENRLADFGVNVIGLWDRGTFHHATPDTAITDSTILLLAGSRAQLEEYDEHFVIYNVSVTPVLILGGGRVGRATAQAFRERGIDYRIVDLDCADMPDPERVMRGDAGDPKVLAAAGLGEAPAVLITTHDDSLNIFLTIYCRSVRPDIQIISRGTLERNAELLHRAGADFVISFASMGATSIFNLLQRQRIISIAEGLVVFHLPITKPLDGTTLATCGVREQTGCNIVAIRDDAGRLDVNPEAATVLRAGTDVILAGSVEAEARFLQKFGEG
jgi:voltage-gated potassium channel